MIAARHENARLQSDFYRDQFHRILRWLMVSVFIMFALIVTIIYFILFKPPQPYYANTTEGQILSMPQAVIGK